MVQDLGVPVAKITPLLSADAAAAVIQARVMESLAFRSPETLEYVPLLATSWKITDNLKAWQPYVDKRLPVPITEAEIVKEADCPPTDDADDRKQYIAARLNE